MMTYEKLSLFKSGPSDSIGLTDVPRPKAILPSLLLDKETIANLNYEFDKYIVEKSNNCDPNVVKYTDLTCYTQVRTCREKSLMDCLS